VYDRYRRPHRWTDSQQRYWTQQRQRVLSTSRDRTATQQTVTRDNWSGFSRPQTTNRRDTTRREDIRRDDMRRDRRSDSTRPQ
jgi:hypothetical protein